jgi:peptide methionine sulfoxide reductase MsrB
MKFAFVSATTMTVLFTVRSVSAFASLPSSTSRSSVLSSSAAAAKSKNGRLFLLDKLFGTSTSAGKLPILAEESVMSPKQHGTSEKPVQSQLRWDCDFQTADRICNFNRHYAEYAGYWTTTSFLKYIKEENPTGPIDFYDSVTGKLLFTAPVGRSMQDFLVESQKHGWPSFRDEEVNWDYVRCLRNGECISTTGTHLGHNLPDSKGNRYCINLVSVAGQPEGSSN